MEDWFLEAACREYPPEKWFPLPKKEPLEHPEETHSPAFAKKVCFAECPVREQCLEMGLATNDVGVWGGYTQRERRAIRRERRRASR